jgi:ubiquinone/menaquinone biosynthesis C-methylase UbiE
MVVIFSATNFFSFGIFMQSESSSYDWLQTYRSLRPYLSTETLTSPSGSSYVKSQLKENEAVPYFPSYDACRVLILGCGNSTFGEEMRNDGWSGEIVNVDFSSVVIDQMNKKYDEKHKREGKQLFGPKMKFVCADITKGIPFEDESFDLIICKGTLDSILCSNGSTSNAKYVVSECARVLASGYGILFLVSYANPDSRVEYLEVDNDLSFYWNQVLCLIFAWYQSLQQKSLSYPTYSSLFPGMPLYPSTTF